MRVLLFVMMPFWGTIQPLFCQETAPTDQMQQLLDQAIADWQFAGGAVGLAVGQETLVATAGLRDKKAELLFESTTLNRIASVAKPMTAVAALQLYEQGKLDLDEPIATYLPSYPQQYASKITTRHLLQHSSGIGAYQSKREAENKRTFASLTEAATVFQDRVLVDEPGRAEHYTTYGYVVLGMVIEAISGQTYEAYMKEHIWKVAGMEQTGVEHSSASYENKSRLYRRTKRGKMRSADVNNLSNRVPGGGLQSTIGDLLKFGKAVLEHRLISETTFAMMMEKPGLPYEGNPYGMGWFLYGENPTLGQVYGHTGAQTGCSAVLLIMPEKEAVVAVLTNTTFALDQVFGLALQLFPLVDKM